MDKETVFRTVQQYTNNAPLLLIGTGGTIPYGIPGMSALSKHLIDSLRDKYNTDTNWNEFVLNISNGVDLESALSNVILNHEIICDIIKHTWKFINDFDIELLKHTLSDKTILPLSMLINKMYTPAPQCVNIVTTNYDRVIEYACDQFNLPTDIRFNGNYLKSFSQSEIKRKNVVNLIKVHGSLDFFKDKDGFVYSIPLQSEIPYGFVPEIITPGDNKYRAILTGQCADLKRNADNLIDKAQSFLCIGYGFNDNQIQRNIIQEIKKGKTIVVITKKLSDVAVELIIKNSSKYVVIQENATYTNKSDVLINTEKIQLEGIYWTVEGFLNII